MHKAAHISFLEADGLCDMRAEGATVLVGEDLRESAVAVDKGRRDVQRPVCTKELLTREVPVKMKTRGSPQEQECLLYALLGEDGGKKKISLLISHVEANEALRPPDPKTRSVDVQQLRRDFGEASRVISSARMRSSWSDKNSSSTTVPIAPLTLSHSFICERSGETLNSQIHCRGGHEIVEAAAVNEENGRRDEAGKIHGRPVTSASRVTEFKDLALDSALVENLRLLGFRIPSPVQCALVPRALDGKNLIVQAKSGTGKTLAFALYVLHALTQRFKQCLSRMAASTDTAWPKASLRSAPTAGSREPKGRHAGLAAYTYARNNEDVSREQVSSFQAPWPSAAADADCIAMALVVTPTRELTIQVANEFSRLGWRLREPRLRHACFFGGRPLSICHQQLAQQPHVLISTPGRLLSLLRSEATRKAVAAWPPSSCARTTNFSAVHCSGRCCQSVVEHGQSSGRYSSGSLPCGSTHNSTSIPEAVGGFTTKKRNVNRRPLQVVQSRHIEESHQDDSASEVGHGESFPFSRRLQQRLCIMVLDEADMLLDHYFRRQTGKLLSATLHPRLQILAVSATFPPPYVSFLEELCYSLDAEMQQDNSQRTESHSLSLFKTESRAMERGQRRQAGVSDRHADVSQQSSIAAATFVRDHALAANAADFRNAATEAYFRNFGARHSTAERDPQCEAEGCLQRQSKSGETSEGGSHGFEGWQDVGESLECPDMGNARTRGVCDKSSQSLRPTAGMPRVFEKVMLCSSLIIQEAPNFGGKREGVDSCSSDRSALRDVEMAVDFSVEAPATDVSLAPLKTTLMTRRDDTSLCRLPECEKVDDKCQSDDRLNQLNGMWTEASGRTAARSPPATWTERKRAGMAEQTIPQTFNRTEDQHSSLADVADKTVDDSLSTPKSSSFKNTLGDVPTVDASALILKTAKDFDFIENKETQADVKTPLCFSPAVADQIHLQHRQRAEQGKGIFPEDFRPCGTVVFPSKNVNNLSREALGGFEARTKIKTESPSLAGISYVIMTVAEEPSLMRQLGAKVRALQHIFASLTFRQAMVFCNEAEAGAQIAACLIRLGVPTLYTSSRLTQERRVRNLLALKQVECRVFICSDVMSRGIDAAAVDLVVNLDIPRDKEIFLHRSGRAGRFGGSGVCVCIASEEEQPVFQYFVNSLKLHVFSSVESLSRLQRMQTPQRGSVQGDVAYGGVADVQEKRSFYRHGESLTGFQHAEEEGQQGMLPVSWQPVGFSGKRFTAEQSPNQFESMNEVLLCSPDNSLRAAEVHTDRSYSARAAGQTVLIRQFFNEGTAKEERSQMFALPHTATQHGSPSLASELGSDTSGSERQTETPSDVHVTRSPSLVVVSYAERESKRARGCKSIFANPEKPLVHFLHRPGEAAGMYVGDFTVSKKTERQQQRFMKLLQEGVPATGSVDLKVTVKCTARAGAVIPVSTDLASGPSDLHPGEYNLCRWRSKSMECLSTRRNGNSLLLQRLQGWQGHNDPFLPGETCILSSLAVAALSSHCGRFCSDTACPFAFMLSSEDVWNAADDRELQVFTDSRNGVLKTKRRTGDAVTFSFHDTEPMTCRDVMWIPPVGGAIPVVEDTHETLKDWETKDASRYRTGPRHHTPLPRCHTAADVGSALLSVKQTHALFWETV